MGQAWQEFLRFPALVVAGWLVCAVLAVLVDRGVLDPGRVSTRALATVVPAPAASTVLENIASGLITVISIVFFVLVMAVQHQSSTYSPVVFDQFLRRRSNQAFFGTMIGETAYCVIVLGLVPSGQAVFSGTLAVLGVAGAMVGLLWFIYSTVDQMRPSAIVWMIQHLALQARRGQQPLLTRCRREPALPGAPELPVCCEQPGYLVHLDGRRLAAAIEAVPAEAEVEIEFVLVMGDHVAPGEVLACVRGGDHETREQLAAQVLAAVTLGRMPDIDHDAGHAVDQLGNMAWSAAAGTDPEGARTAIRTLHSLLACWSQQPDPSPEQFGGPLPIVYHDRVVPKVLDALTSVIAAAAPVGQHQSASYALRTLAEALPRLAPDDQTAAIDRVQRVLPTVTSHVYTRDIEHALAAIHTALERIGHPTQRDRVGEITRQLSYRHRFATPHNGTHPRRTGNAELS